MGLTRTCPPGSIRQAYPCLPLLPYVITPPFSSPKFKGRGRVGLFIGEGWDEGGENKKIG